MRPLFQYFQVEELEERLKNKWTQYEPVTKIDKNGREYTVCVENKSFLNRNRLNSIPIFLQFTTVFR